MQGFERVLADCLSSAIVAHKYIFASRWSDYGFVYALDHQRLFKRREPSINTAA